MLWFYSTMFAMKFDHSCQARSKNLATLVWRNVI